jgi:hypothetical protein
MLRVDGGTAESRHGLGYFGMGLASNSYNSQTHEVNLGFTDLRALFRKKIVAHTRRAVFRKFCRIHLCAKPRDCQNECRLRLR